MSASRQTALTLATFSYPFLVYWGLANGYEKALLILLAGLVTYRCFAAKTVAERRLNYVFAPVMVAMILLWDAQSGIKIYPVLVNMALLLLFAETLVKPPSMIERFARMREPNLPEAAVQYTRVVTWVWCGFFVVNGLTALITALWCSDKVWMLYNGVISYLLIGLLFAGEWCVRQYVKRSF